jgi:polyphenol oxidase
LQQETLSGLPLFRFETFSLEEPVRHAVFTRLGGVSEGPYASLNLSASVSDNRDRVYANRARAYGTHDRRYDSLVHAHLIHGAEVAQVGRAEYGRHVGPIDGLITDEPGCGLTMNFADCTPILLYDPIHKAIGLGHAGWQGAVKDLPGAMVRAMQEAYGSQPTDLLAGVGPCIGACCYEVDEPVIGAVYRAFDEPGGLLVQNGGPRPHFDLPQANYQRLAAAGVRHIELSDLCTACRTDLFFSHRAEKGRTGRFGALLILD